jgi:hypothetical protein
MIYEKRLGILVSSRDFGVYRGNAWQVTAFRYRSFVHEYRKFMTGLFS